MVRKGKKKSRREIGGKEMELGRGGRVKKKGRKRKKDGSFNFH